MTLAPLAEASLAIQIHVAAAVFAFGLGMVILFRRKGTSTHQISGYAWVILMLVTAFSSFAINELRVWGEWSPIHLLSIATIVSLGWGVWLARNGRVQGHLNTMRVTFAGALVIAGLFSFMPGRIMHAVLFSADNSFIVRVVAGTPFWVWLLLAGLILLGILRSRDRVVPRWRLYTLPISILLLTLTSLVRSSETSLVAGAMALGLAPGLAAGFLVSRTDEIRFVAGKAAVGGEWLSLVLLLCVFALQYANGLVSAMMPQLAADTAWIVLHAAASAFLSGLVIGRSWGWHRALLQAE